MLVVVSVWADKLSRLRFGLLLLFLFVWGFGEGWGVSFALGCVLHTDIFRCFTCCCRQLGLFRLGISIHHHTANAITAITSTTTTITTDCHTTILIMMTMKKI